MHRYYVLKGKTAVPVADLHAWSTAFELDDRHVAQTQIGPMWISTVFLGINHQFNDTGPPILFETMIFCGSWGEEYMARCSTWKQAERQHADAVKVAQEWLASVPKEWAKEGTK